MNETGLPLTFPDAHGDAHARALEFLRLPVEERLNAIFHLMEFGFKMVHSSPRRAAIEKRWQEEEAEWQRIQQQLFLKQRK